MAVPASFDAAIDAINTAIDGDDYSTARKNLLFAKTLAAKLPDVSAAGRSISRGVAFAMLKDLTETVNDLERRYLSGGQATQVVPVSFGRPA